FVLILSLFSVLLALGGHTPLLRLLYDAGIATSIRYPEKFLMIAIFAIIIFTAKMFDRMLGGDDGVRDAAMGFVLATTIVAVAITLLGFTRWYADAFMGLWGLQGASGKKMVDISHTGWMIAAARGATLFALLWSLRRIKRPVWLVLMGAFLAADLGPVVHQLNPRMPAAFFREKPEALREFPEDRRQFRIFHEADWYGQEAPARKYFSTGDAVYWIVRNGLYPMTPAGHGLSMAIERDYDKTALLPTIDFTESVWDVKREGREDWWRPMMAMSNAWYRATYRPFDEERKRVKGNMKVAQPLDFTLIERFPRYYFADAMVTVTDRRHFVKEVVSAKHGERTAFVYGPSFQPAEGVVQQYQETANTATIDIEATGRSFLVMSVTPNKHWKITVDGQPVQPIVTNVGYQGIEVPAGRHTVGMQYRNELGVAGMKISTTALLLLLGAAVWPVKSAAADPHCL
ncbi:MAG TPA: YfhO family protein, partial [Thermoanaerobaculia bacterium]